MALPTFSRFPGENPPSQTPQGIVLTSLPSSTPFTSHTLSRSLVRGSCISRTGRRAKTRLTISKSDFREGGKGGRGRGLVLSASRRPPRIIDIILAAPILLFPALTQPLPLSAALFRIVADISCECRDRPVLSRASPNSRHLPCFRISRSSRAFSRADTFQSV